MDRRAGSARYVFRVEFRLDPARGLSAEPDRFETVVHRGADPPGDPGWLFFRDTLWRGELADPGDFRELLEAALDVGITTVSFSELQATEPYLDALRAAVADNLEEFRAESVDEALTKYLGSSIRVVDGLNG